jgi:hypothetical protein
MASLITGIDHLLIHSGNLERDAADYESLLGATATLKTGAAGVRTATLEAGNLSLVLRESGTLRGLGALCFAVNDSTRFERRLGRLGMGLRDAAAGSSQATPGETRLETTARWLRSEDTRGLSVGFVERRQAAHPLQPRRVSGLDHLVIASGDAEGTAFLLGARLGLDLRMDLTNEAWGARLLFFRCGDLIVEVFQALDAQGNAEAPAEARELPREEDSFYGLSWRTRDAAAANTALAQQGFDVSPLRQGRKPGTRVFTVRDRTAGVATLMLDQGATATAP